MKLLKSVYVDDDGNIWQIKKVALTKLTKKRGTYYIWDAECDTLKLGLYANKKKELLTKIKNLLDFKKQTNEMYRKSTQ